MAWATITTDTSWQSLAVAQQLAVAFNRRATVVGADSIETRLGVAEIGEGVRVYDFVRAMQVGIESIATSFSLASATLAGQASLPANFASVSAMMTAAGLTQSGYWRRAAEGGAAPDPWTPYAGWSYGKMETGDLAGPWLFKDLQVALTAMTRVVVPVASATFTSYAEKVEGAEYTEYPDLPSAELTGSVSMPPPTSTSSWEVFVSVTKERWFNSSLSMRFWQIGAFVRIARLRSLYTPPFGVANTTNFVVLIPSAAPSAFSPVTGWSDASIGKTVLLPTTDRGDGYANAWVPRNPSLITPTWSALSSILPWSSVPYSSPQTAPTVIRMDVSQVNCVHDFSFSE